MQVDFDTFMDELQKELELLRKKVRAALHVTNESTLNYLLRYDEYLASKPSLSYPEWLEQNGPVA
jgi:hypothetical protein